MVIFAPPRPAVYHDVDAAVIFFFPSELKARRYFLGHEGPKARPYSQQTRNVFVRWHWFDTPASWRRLVSGCLQTRR